MAILEHLKSYKDLMNLDKGDISILCQDVRDMIIDVTFKNGGHLASSLGTVELTVSLLRNFDPESDKIVFDVGHQTYPYKILTDRRDRFNTLRQAGGISGFPKREESRYDHFNVGHSSTSLSASLGYAKARDIAKENHEVVAVIGDGSIINGMAFEALNYVKETDSKVIYVLNDNTMSISPRVGGASSHFAYLSANPYYRSLKKSIKECCKNIPKGETIEHILGRAKDQIKSLVKPGNIFDSLDISYWGPFDGHSVEEMDLIFKLAHEYDKPVLIHLITQKGRGCEDAEKDPSTYHGIPPAPAKKRSGIEVKKEPSWSSVATSAMEEMAVKDSRIVALTAAMKEGSKLCDFEKHFPDRFFDVGIAEEHMLTFAAGMAAGGLRPVVFIYSTFLQRAMDQLVHDICLQNLPVVLAVDRAGLIGDDGETHQGLFDISWGRVIPNLVVQSPRDSIDLHQMMSEAIDREGPTMIRYPRGSSIRAIPETRVSSYGGLGAEMLCTSTDWNLVGIGKTVEFMIKIREEARRRGIPAPGVIDLRTISPIDYRTIDAVLLNSKLLITAEDGYKTGGIGEALATRALEIGATPEFHRLGVPDQFISHNSIIGQWEHCEMTVEKVMELYLEKKERKTG